jgi:hypothetical protein
MDNKNPIVMGFEIEWRSLESNVFLVSIGQRVIASKWTSL